EGGGLEDEHVLAAHVLLNLDEDLLIGEAADAGLSERNVEVAGDGFGQHPVGVARKQFHEHSPAKDMSGLLTASARIASAKGADRTISADYPPVFLERRASFRTHKGRSNCLNLRIVLSENRSRFSGRCRGFIPVPPPARRRGGRRSRRRWIPWSPPARRPSLPRRKRRFSSGPGCGGRGFRRRRSRPRHRS